MAPRSVKVKKVADAKVSENEAPKKGRGRPKASEDVDLEIETDDIEEAPVVEKKTKRGKKAANEQQNGKNDENAPVPKRGRKKNIEEPIIDKPEEDPVVEDEGNDENTDANCHTEEPQTSGRGRKKQQPKKETDTNAPKPGRGRKAKPADSETTENNEKPKAGKGRGRKAQAKVEEAESDQSNEPEEEVKPDPPAKGKKRVQKTKEKTPESDNEAEEEKIVEEPKKKETKGRKNQNKRAQTKEEIEEDEGDKEESAAKKRKVTKKEDKGKGDVKEEEEGVEEEKEVPEPKPAKGRRGQKKAVEVQAETEEEHQENEEPTAKRRRKVPEDKVITEDSKKKAPLKNKSATSYEDIDFTNTSKTSQGKDWNYKISCWNVDGIRAWLNKGGLEYIKYEKPDILCLQEIKCSKDKLPEEIANLPGYHPYWLHGDKEGYAGVGIYTTQLAINVHYGLDNEELDDEGRIITVEYEQFYLICTYVPNAGRKLVTLSKRLQWNEEFRKYVKELDKKKPVIICGDMNVSHKEIDLANPKTNRKNAGFTDEERAGMTDLLNEGFVDTYRHFNLDTTGAYTFWTYMMNSRAKNVGWRLDYFLVSERLMPSVADSVIRNQVYGSDHCPITLFLHLTSANLKNKLCD